MVMKRRIIVNNFPMRDRLLPVSVSTLGKLYCDVSLVKVKLLTPRPIAFMHIVKAEIKIRSTCNSLMETLFHFYYPPFASIAKGEVFGLLYVCLLEL